LGSLIFAEFAIIILGRLVQKVVTMFIKLPGRATQELTYKMIMEKQKRTKLDK
jgi:hypothetical protein